MATDYSRAAFRRAHNITDDLYSGMSQEQRRIAMLMETQAWFYWQISTSRQKLDAAIREQKERDNEVTKECPF